VEFLTGNNSLVEAIQGYGINNTYSTLHPVFFGDDPDNSISSVPYDKGAQLLAYIQSVIGNAMMQKFITYYINNNALKSISSFDMQRTFSNFIQTQYQDPE
jgi:leukotriene-A4 hydrolase